METSTIKYKRAELQVPPKVQKPNWARIILLSVLGYEGAGCLSGGGLLVTSPDGRYMNMPVDIMHGVFRDFLIPGIILFGLGILTTAAFFAVLRRKNYDWILASAALGGLAIWFWVEITILQAVHWLHIMWGLPVVIGLLVLPSELYTPSTTRKSLLMCGIVTSLLYIGMNIFIPMQWPAYNSFSQTVSELSAVHAPTRSLWVPMGFLYAILFVGFGWGVLKSSWQNKRIRIIGILLILNGLISIVWPFTPMHLREDLAAGGSTISDTLHITFAIVTVLLMLLAMGFGAAAFGKTFRIYSIASIITQLGFGILTSIDAPQIDTNLPTPYLGVWERFNIGIFLLWMIVLALILLKDKYNSEKMSL